MDHCTAGIKHEHLPGSLLEWGQTFSKQRREKSAVKNFYMSLESPAVEWQHSTMRWTFLDSITYILMNKTCIVNLKRQSPCIYDKGWYTCHIKYMLLIVRTHFHFIIQNAPSGDSFSRLRIMCWRSILIRNKWVSFVFCALLHHFTPFGQSNFGRKSWNERKATNIRSPVHLEIGLSITGSALVWVC